MTPARYDVLALLFGPTPSVEAQGGRTYRLPQHELQQMLGLAHATVSELVKKLVELGLVTRHRCDLDRRLRIVVLARPGFDAIRAAFQLVHGGRAVAKAYERFAFRAFSPRRLHDRDVALAGAIDRAFEIAEVVGNTTPSIHPFRIRKAPDNPPHSARRCHHHERSAVKNPPFEAAIWHVEAEPGPRSRRVDFEDYDIPSYCWLERDARGRWLPDDGNRDPDSY